MPMQPTEHRPGNPIVSGKKRRRTALERRDAALQWGSVIVVRTIRIAFAGLRSVGNLPHLDLLQPFHVARAGADVFR